MNSDIKEVLFSREQLAERVKELGERISSDYRGKTPVLVGILKGSVMFMSDLLKEIDIECSVDFMAVSSYAGETETSGVVKIIMDLRESIKDRHVLLVEDIVDTGLTMAYLRDNLKTRHPATFSICTLLSKPGARKTQVKLDYVGFEVPDRFVVGYGLDFQEKYRNFPYIATLKPEIYRRK